jgi:uncharacterized DUF497 family protein
MEFEWDDTKATQNLRKHGVSFHEAVDSFLDPFGFAVDDIRHSSVENRRYWVGKSPSNRIITTWYTRRESRIRIIGAAEFRNFRKLYEIAKNKKYPIK